MIARLQRLLLLTLTVGVGLAFATAVWTDHMSGAIAILVAAVSGHASVLALEFAWMQAANRRSSSLPAPRSSVVLAWLSECLHAPQVFCWRQPFRHQAWADHLPPSDQRGVLLIHGFFCNRGLWNPWMKRLRAQGVPYVALTLEPPFGSIDAYADQIGIGMHRLTTATGKPPIVVAHSMGGLAFRRWWRDRAGSGSRVHHVVTLGTPHHGTRLARLAVSANGREMREDGAWLSALSRAEYGLPMPPMTCFYSNCDNIVFPAERATLAGAENRHLPATPHVAMVDHPAPWAEVQRLLRT